MLKIWSRICVGEKIKKDCICEFDESQITFYEMMKEIAYKLDIPTPVILNKHVLDLKRFNISSFVKSDFVESVNFTKLVIETVKE